MRTGDKVEVRDMGFMGLENYLGKIVGIAGDEKYIVDFGRPCFIESQIQVVHKSRIKLV